MPPTLQLPDIRRLLDGFDRRLGILERRVRPTPAATAAPHEIIFSHSGLLVVTWSPPALLQTDSTLFEVVGSLGNPGSSTTTVEVKKNGSTIATLTFDGGEIYAETSASAGYAADSDQVIVAVTAVGTDAADLTVQARFR